MLNPHDRRLFLESLRPPQGYELSFAIGTTFTLDLMALLAAPLAFTWYRAQDEHGRVGADPLALLDAARRHAERIHVFCQSGYVQVPRAVQLLYSYLEGSVIEVAPPRSGGVFHPKVWVLRYSAPDLPVRYRLLCMSRNLTFDRSWDTVLVLEGELLDRKQGFGVNRPLSDFIAALPGLAVREVREQARVDVEIARDELRRVQWRCPEGLRDYAFWPIGFTGGRTRPFQDTLQHARRLLVVSPFLSAEQIPTLAGTGKRNVLVSRMESLDALSAQELRPFESIFVLSGEAEPATEEAAEAPTGEVPALGEQDQPLTGLHAKLYLAEVGNDVRLWTGSANATGAAYSRNVEFLVELRGDRKALGIDAVMAQARGVTGLRDLLVPYTPSETPIVPDPATERLVKRLEQARRAIAAAHLTATVSALEDEAAYGLELCTDGPLKVPAGVEVRCWPVTLAGAWARPLSPTDACVASWERISLESISSFYAFEVRASDDAIPPLRFVLNLPLTGAPEGRHEGIVRSLLSSRDRVLRFLLMLLAGDAVDLPVPGGGWPGPGQSGPGNGITEDVFPLFETLVGALDRSPEKLDHVARIVKELGKRQDSRDLLPPGWEEIWEPIRQARAGQRS